MKMLRYLFAFALAVGLCPHAKAFQMVVLDPTYSVDTITDFSSFGISFAPCVSPGQTPTGSSFVGCFSFQNETTAPITELDISVNGLIPGQSVGCALSSTGLDVFSDPSCSDVSSGYVLTFTGGTIAVGEIVTIAELGVDPGSFPPTTVTPLAASTPEPSSFYLLSTGIGAVGAFVGRRRLLIRALQK